MKSWLSQAISYPKGLVNLRAFWMAVCLAIAGLTAPVAWSQTLSTPLDSAVTAPSSEEGRSAPMGSVAADQSVPLLANRRLSSAAQPESPKAATAQTSAASSAPEPPSDFQKFVEQSTGQMLPIFGASLFRNGRIDALQETQVPDSYVVGPGDELLLQIYGAIDFADRVVVDRDGRILLPKVGPIKVAGTRYGQLEATLTRQIGEVYRNFKITVSMGKLRSIEIYVLGQARDPGRKVVSSLSTMINALFQTGGPSARGSLRGIELRRGGKVVARVDLYDFIARGDNQGDRPLEPGDILFIPPVGAQVAVSGTVNEPAIYELPAGGGNLQALLALTGGLPPIANPRKAQLERVNSDRQPARSVQDIVLDGPGLNTPLKAGDIVTVMPVSPQFSNAVTLQGSVSSPMRYPHKEGMRVSDLVANNNFLVPISYWLRLNAGTPISGLDQREVNLEYATVQRLDPVRLRTETIPFHLAKALLGDPTENLVLKSGDLVRVYGADEAPQDAFNSVMLSASFLDANGFRRNVWRQGYRITDVIPDLNWLREEVTRAARTAGVATSKLDLAKGVAGVVKPQELQKRSANTATGQNGGAGPERLSVTSLQEINLGYADIRRMDPVSMQIRLIPFNLGAALAGDLQHNLQIQPGDRISLYTKQEVAVPIALQTRLVRVLGEVGVPGTYQVSAGDNLVSLIERAGGFTQQAYRYGTVFTRESTRQEQQKNLAQLVRVLEADIGSQANAAAQNTTKPDSTSVTASLEFQRQALERLRTTQVTGRIALDMDDLVGSPELPKLELEDGDSIFVPAQTDFVTVYGAVDISNAMIHRSGQKVSDYLERAGLRPWADIDNVAVLKADGTVRTARTLTARTSFFGLGSGANLMDQLVRPGDAILVPEKADRQSGYTVFMNYAKDWTQLIYQFGLGAAALKTIRQ